jgi:uncharacterized protein (TIRG00374 family)
VKHLWIAVLALLAGVGLLGLVVYVAGAREIAAILARLSVFELLALVATAFAVTLFTSLAWQLILEQEGHTLPLWLLFRLTVVTFAVGWAIPSGFVAGIPAAAYFLRRRGVPLVHGFASFVVGRFFEISGFALVLPAILLSRLGAHPGVRALSVAMLVAIGFVYLDLLFGWRVARRSLLRLQSALRPGIGRRSFESAVDFCASVSDFFRAPFPRMLLVAWYALLADAAAFLRSLLTAMFLQLHLTLPEIVVMFVVTVFLISIPFLPGAIGVYEGGIAGAFELVGRSRADGVAYAMSIHAAELAVVAVGFLFLGHLGIGVVRRDRADPARSPRVRRVHRPA